MAEAKSGYCLKWKLYTSKNDEAIVSSNPEKTTTYQIVKHLAQSHLQKGHILYMDNYYSSPCLALDLQNEGTGSCGTVRITRKGMPTELKQDKTPLQKGDDPVFMKCTGTQLIACAWQDTKRVSMLSTVHNSGCGEKEIRDKNSETGFRTVLKPFCVEQYNKYMGGVDTLDQRAKTYFFPHRSRKWYRRIFDMLISMSMVNAHILFKSATKKKMPLSNFIEDVVAELLNFHELPPPSNRANRQSGHYPSKAKTRDCNFCSKHRESRKKTNTYCRICDKHLCYDGCFEAFHLALENQ